MAGPFDLVVEGGTVVSARASATEDVGVRDGKIAAVGSLAGAAAGERFDARGLHVLPGVIDSQVHFREPGGEHKEDLESGTRAAVLGGVACVFEMPNTDPPTTTEAALQDKCARAEGRAWTDFAFFVGACAENVAALADLERLPGCCGVKIFMGSSTGTLLVPDDVLLERVLKSGSRRVAVHAEDEPRLRERRPIAEAADDVSAHPEWRDVETARRATERLLRFAYSTGRPAHVLHITTADEIELLAARPGWVSVECTPQHLTLAAPECYERLGAYAQMNPPIRDAAHREGLWRGVAGGIVDVIGSDHAPHSREEKERPYPPDPVGNAGRADPRAADAEPRGRRPPRSRTPGRSRCRSAGGPRVPRRNASALSGLPKSRWHERPLPSAYPLALRLVLQAVEQLLGIALGERETRRDHFRSQAFPHEVGLEPPRWPAPRFGGYAQPEVRIGHQAPYRSVLDQRLQVVHRLQPARVLLATGIEACL